MSSPQDLDDALRRWWNLEHPRARHRLFKHIKYEHFPDELIREIARCTGDAFRAGWRAHENHQAASGEQILLGEDPK